MGSINCLGGKESIQLNNASLKTYEVVKRIAFGVWMPARGSSRVMEFEGQRNGFEGQLDDS